MVALSIIGFSLAAVLGVIDIIQFIYRREEKKALLTQALAAFLGFHHVATFCDDAREQYKDDGEDIAEALIRHLETIRGIADEARLYIKAFCHVQYGINPKYEHPLTEEPYQVTKVKLIKKQERPCCLRFWSNRSANEGRVE